MIIHIYIYEKSDIHFLINGHGTSLTVAEDTLIYSWLQIMGELELVIILIIIKIDMRKEKKYNTQS